jgi:hypothetical protein
MFRFDTAQWDHPLRHASLHSHSHMRERFCIPILPHLHICYLLWLFFPPPSACNTTIDLQFKVPYKDILWIGQNHLCTEPLRVLSIRFIRHSYILRVIHPDQPRPLAWLVWVGLPSNPRLIFHIIASRFGYWWPVFPPRLSSKLSSQHGAGRSAVDSVDTLGTQVRLKQLCTFIGIGCIAQL